MRRSPAFSRGHVVSVTDDARHRRQFGGRNRDPEKADRKQCEVLGVADQRHRAHRQPAGEELVDVSAELHDTARDEHRPEVPGDGAHLRRAGVQLERQPMREPQD